MEHEMAMRQMRAHLAHAGREIRSARQFLETPAGRDTNLALGGGGERGGKKKTPPSPRHPPPPTPRPPSTTLWTRSSIA
jgi:hypothetical protein